MNRRLLVVLLVLTFVLGSVSSFWSKPASANTGEERRVMLCAAWPWNNDLCQSGNPSPPDTSGLSNIGNQARLQNTQQNATPKRAESGASNLFHRLLRTLCGVLFPESF